MKSSRPLFCSQKHCWNPLRSGPLPEENGLVVCPRCGGALRALVPPHPPAVGARGERREKFVAVTVLVLLFPGIVLLTWLSVSRWSVHGLQFSSDGKILALDSRTLDGNGRVQLVDLAANRALTGLGSTDQRIFLGEG